MPGFDITLRTTSFAEDHPRYEEAMSRAVSEISWAEGLFAEADDILQGEILDEVSEDDLEVLYGAAEAAEYLLENPNAAAIQRDRDRLDDVEHWAACRPAIERQATERHRSASAGEGA